MERHPFLTALAVAKSELRTRLAVEILAAVEADATGTLVLTKTARFEDEQITGDLIEVKLCPAVPTYPAYPIAPSEPILFFLPDDSWKAPEVYALREDFPNVPHLNLSLWAYPRLSLIHI